MRHGAWCYSEGQYSCLACGHKGRLRGGIWLDSKCRQCGDFMILPELNKMQVLK